MTASHSTRRRAFVVQFSSAGDVVLTSPAVDALRKAWPDEDFLRREGGILELVRHNPNVDEVVTLEKGEGLLDFTRRVRALQYGALLDLHGNLRSAVLRAFLPGGRGTRAGASGRGGTTFRCGWVGGRIARP